MPQKNASSKSIKQSDIVKHAKQLLQSKKNSVETLGLFKVRSANEWIEESKKYPIPRKLFGEFWLEGELCILFAENGVGKSLLAVQIGDSISKGEIIEGFLLEAPKQSVLLFDFELSGKQFEGRYSKDYKNHYKFDESFIRAEIDPINSDYKEKGFENFEDYLSFELERMINSLSIKILIIDNITYLKTETEKARDALPLMKRLIELKKKYGLSILVLAHTPKRDLHLPINRNHLQGSKHLSNLADSIFAIGESHTDNGTRYLKQIKARSIEVKYDGENVCICQLIKPTNFLHFQFMDYGKERDHLKPQTDSDKENKIAEAKKLRKEGLNNIEIAKRFGVSEAAIRKWFKKGEKK